MFENRLMCERDGVPKLWIHFQFLIVGLAGLGVLTGCQQNQSGSELDGIARVSGQVFLDGEPLVDGKVVFVPNNVSAKSKKWTFSYAMTDKEGRFELRLSESQKGAHVGENMVLISTKQLEIKEPKKKVKTKSAEKKASNSKDAKSPDDAKSQKDADNESLNGSDSKEQGESNRDGKDKPEVDGSTAPLAKKSLDPKQGSKTGEKGETPKAGNEKSGKEETKADQVAEKANPAEGEKTDDSQSNSKKSANESDTEKTETNELEITKQATPERIPARYNRDSELIFDVPAEGTIDALFRLTSEK